MPRRVAAFLVLLCALLFAGIATAQTAIVERNVNLRRDPSTAKPAIRLLAPNTSLTLIQPDKTNDYFHVRTQAS